MLQVEATCVAQSKLKLYFLQQILVLLLDILHHWSYNLPHNKFEFQPLWLAVISVAMREIERTNMVEGEEEPELAVDQKLSETQICPLQRPQAKGYHDSVHDTLIVPSKQAAGKAKGLEILLQKHNFPPTLLQ